MPYCPECRDEYVVGIERCPDCDAELVNDLSDVPVGPPHGSEEDAADVKAVSHHAEESEAAAAAAILLSVAIPARVGAETEQGWAVEVPPEFFSSASRILRRGPGDSEDEPEVIPPDLALLELSFPALRKTGEEGVAGLMRLLVRGRGEIVGRAAMRLVRLGGAAETVLLDALVSAVAANSDEIPPAVVKAMQALGRRIVPPGLPPLTRAEKPEVRIRAVRTLAGIGGPDAVLPALALLRDPEEEVREEAADAVWELSKGQIDLNLDGDPAVLERDIRTLEEHYRG